MGSYLKIAKEKYKGGEVPSQKKLSSNFEELFSIKVPRQKELSSSNEEISPNPKKNNFTFA